MNNSCSYVLYKHLLGNNILTKGLLLCFVISFLSLSAYAQLRLSTLPKKEFQQHPSKQNNARTQSIAPLQLPFWDDFSVFALDAKGKPSGHPDTIRWVNSNSVWVNNGMGINPPSINVASLDGLDSTYQAYEPSQIFTNGFTDKLISRPIDMTGVPVDNRDSVYMRFFYQWQGNGEGPDKTDYFVVELKDSTNKWVTAMTIYPKEKPDRTIFYDTLLQIVDDNEHVFMHDDFQFRFRRYGRKSGPFDTWNIDYIYLNHFYERDFLSISDAALSRQLESFIKPYWSVPYKHWITNKKLDTLDFRVTSHKNGSAPQTIDHVSYATISNYFKSNLLSKSYAVLPNDPKGDQPPLPPLSSRNYVIRQLPDTTAFDVNADSVVFDFKLALNSSDLDPQNYFPYYAPIDFRSNDTITSTTIFNNYYAYDDGVAEYAVYLTNAGNASAYRFDMLVPKDTLLGFYVYFPDYGIITSQSTKFAVYTDNNGLPSNKPIVQPTVFINRKGLNNFTKVQISPGVPVDSSFYIGWIESTAGTVKVGLDMNNDTGNRMFERVNGFWAQSQFIHGSMMIRPILGSDKSVVTGLPEEEENLIVYPNPTSGSFFVNGIHDDLKIINITGQLINFTKEDFGHESKITINTAPGLYLLQIRTGKATIVKKIIIK